MTEPRNEGFLKILDDRRSKILVGVSIVCCVGMLAFAVAYATAYSSVSLLSALTRDSLTNEEYLTKRMMSMIEAESLDDSLQFLSLKPHAAGEDRLMQGY